MSMDQHKCKLCSRKFLSGKALGGHMRSHLMVLPLPPKTPPLKQDSGGHSESTLSLSSSENQEQNNNKSGLALNYGLRENPKKSFRMVDPEFLDRESETESTRTKPRSKRSPRIFMHENNKNKEKSLSLFSDSSSEEDIAMCLLMLSRDVWPKGNNWAGQKNVKKYQCGICNKMFKCSQGLGSHRAIHNNFEQKPSSKTKKVVLVKDIVDKKLHECPFCGKHFQSGQALGGHKRTHFMMTHSSTTITGSSSSSKLGESLMDSNSAKLPNGFIDLNMPAPMEEEDDDEDDFSQPHFSAVSHDADFQELERG